MPRNRTAPPRRSTLAEVQELLKDAISLLHAPQIPDKQALSTAAEGILNTVPLKGRSTRAILQAVMRQSVSRFGTDISVTEIDKAIDGALGTNLNSKNVVNKVGRQANRISKVLSANVRKTKQIELRNRNVDLNNLQALSQHIGEAGEAPRQGVRAQVERQMEEVTLELAYSKKAIEATWKLYNSTMSLKDSPEKRISGVWRAVPIRSVAVVALFLAARVEGSLAQAGAPASLPGLAEEFDIEEKAAEKAYTTVYSKLDHICELAKIQLSGELPEPKKKGRKQS